MGKNTFTISFDDGTTASKSITIAEPSIIRGWWSSDREGNNNLKESQLGETVFFHIETKGIAEGKELELKLYDRDYYLLSIINLLDRDDDEFPDKEVKKKATIRKIDRRGYATVELLLSEKWESVVKDDIEKFANLDKKIELYWEVKYGDKLNEKVRSELKVGFSDRTLYFKSPIDGHNLPELISYDGSPLLLMKLAGSKIKGEVKNKIGGLVSKAIDDTISDIALAKMEKGSLATTSGQVYTKNSQIYSRDIYTNDGKLLKDVKQRNNFGYKQGDDLITSKGLSQYDYFTTTGKRVTILGFLRNAGHLLDFAGLLNNAKNGFDTSKPLSIPMGPLSPINDLAGVLIQQYSNDLEETLEMVVQDELAEAKEEGLKGVQRFVNKWGQSNDYKYQLLSISNETFNNLLNGNFKKFSEVEIFENSLDGDLSSVIYVLSREVRIGMKIS
ncbi:MAG: hypothetical protein JKX79_07850 [Labilibaculum sp.]|nr:hypothetical protein [Labilibaculum sp.]